MPLIVDPRFALTSSDDDTDAEDAPRCFNCETTSNHLLLCSTCRKVRFCNAACQRASWRAHAVVCARDATSRPRVEVPQPPRMPTARERAAAAATARERVAREVLPNARDACAVGERRGRAPDGFDAIVDALEDAIVFAIEDEDEGLTNAVRVTLARAYLVDGRPDECAHYLAPALERARREGGAESAMTHVLAARAHKAKNEKEMCRKELTAALECASENTDEGEQCATLLECGTILHDIGDWERCAPLLSTAGEAAERLGRNADATRACWLRELKVMETDAATLPAALAQTHGNSDSFNLHKQFALGKAREAGAEEEARVWLQLGSAYKLAGEALDDALSRARECFEKAKELSSERAGDVASRALEMLTI
ncbi:hypothetical protein BE221DRAFT_74934 [Ostreococcus tauri]|uniref:MYND-type domain-containing protein n=1 Tax=Ostreococcus tauri TaxID=70448 RepID=A0A1Y5ID58_OSTTA|nr:hypothetical protein BE221DRAFT_74934 [Ostreococcus tauri]